MPLCNLKKIKPKKSSFKTSAEQLPPNYNPMTGKFTEKLDPVGKEDADINNDGKVDKTDDYLKNRRKTVSKAIQKEGDLDLGHQDNEPHMLKKDLYRIAKYASELYMMVNNFDNKGMEVDFPHWWQSKIIKAKSMLVSAKHYLDGELTIPQIDAMLEEEMDLNDPALVAFRAARDRTNKILSQPKPDFVAPKRKKDNSDKIAFLQKERDALMNDMEQEAEPEGKYEDYMIGLRNDHVQSAMDGYKSFMEDRIKQTNANFVTEAGDVENWKGGISKEQIQQELQEGIEFLEGLKIK